jgi:hypothetical protein
MRTTMVCPIVADTLPLGDAAISGREAEEIASTEVGGSS